MVGEQQQQIKTDVMEFDGITNFNRQDFVPTRNIGGQQFVQLAMPAQNDRVVVGEFNVQLTYSSGISFLNLSPKSQNK